MDGYAWHYEGGYDCGGVDSVVHLGIRFRGYVFVRQIHLGFHFHDGVVVDRSLVFLAGETRENRGHVGAVHPVGGI